MNQSGRFAAAAVGNEQPIMDDATRYAYRNLLYWAMLDLRRLDKLVYRPASMLNPFRWPSFLKQIRQAAALAEWLHNLGQLSALEFDHFDETRFWRDYERAISRYPDLKRYKEVFDRSRSKYVPPKGAV